MKIENKVTAMALSGAAIGMGTVLALAAFSMNFSTREAAEFMKDPASKIGERICLRGDLRFVAFHPSPDARSYSYRGQTADLSKCGTFEFSLSNKTGTARVFLPSSTTTFSAPAGLHLHQSDLPGAGLISPESAKKGHYDGSVSAAGQVVTAVQGVGLYVEEIFIPRARSAM